MSKDFQQTWRVYDSHMMDDKLYEDLEKHLLKYEDTTDEVAFIITEPSYGAYHPLENVAKRAEIFKERAERLRKRGIKVGMNVWPSFGNGERYTVADARPANPFPRMIGMNGSAAEHLACPVSEEFLEYVHQKYVILAKAEPDFIWVDDDTRLTHLGSVPYPCFCENCVKNFENGRFSGREELVEALNKAENKELRRKWTEYGGDRLTRVCEEIRSAVDEVDPAVETPFMSVGPSHTTFSGEFISKCMKALRSPKGRPGHGFYWETTGLEEMLGKCMEAGRQIVAYPDFIREVHYEEDSYPYGMLEKSLRTRRNEISLALAVGCTGVAFIHFQPNPGLDRLFEREIKELHERRPSWERYGSFAKGLKWAGLWPAFSWNMAAEMDCENGWFHEVDPDYDIQKPEALGRIGLPLTADKESACATLLAGKTLLAFSREELKEIFSGNVFMDVYALLELQKMGLESWAGVTAGEGHYSNREVLNDHPFNGEFEGFERNAIWLPAVDLIPLDEKVESLAYSRDPYGNAYGMCLSKYENELGGKIVVSGYDCWRYTGDPHKIWQLREIAEWMGTPVTLHWKDSMRVSRIQPFIRTDGKRAAVLLINASLDSSEEAELVIRGSMAKAVAVAEDGSDIVLNCTREEGALRVQLPVIQGWDTLTILAE